MLITLLGTATSQGIPVIGCNCKACLSSDPHDKRLRCSALVSDNETNVIIDVGPDFRQQMLRAGIFQLDAVVITHEHNDHIIGLDDLRPFIFKNRRPMKIYAESRVIEEIKKRFEYAFIDHAYPGAPSFELIPIIPNELIKINNLEMLPLRVLHGSLPILGFKVGKLAYFTDTNQIPEETMTHLHDLDYVIMDALRNRPHHSHNTINEAIEKINRIKPLKGGYLIHMSHLLGPVKEWSQDLPANIFPAFDGIQFEL